MHVLETPMEHVPQWKDQKLQVRKRDRSKTVCLQSFDVGAWNTEKITLALIVYNKHSKVIGRDCTVEVTLVIVINNL